MQNAHLKKRVMAALISTAVVAGGTVVATPSAHADIAVTSKYSQLPADEQQAAVQFNSNIRYQQGAFNQAHLMYANNFGPGWCIDFAQPAPQQDSPYVVRKLDGVSGLYGYNGEQGGNLEINPDIERAAIAGTKRMLDAFNKGDMEQAAKLNFALQALLSNHKETLNLQRGYIYGDYKETTGGFPKITKEEFAQWTGFEVRKQSGSVSGQSQYVLRKSASFQEATSNVQDGEYVTVLVPRDYNISDELGKEGTTQRLITIGQPGLVGYEPNPKGPNVTVKTTTVTETPEVVTKTETVPGNTYTKTVTEQPVTETARKTVTPTSTVTEWEQPQAEVTKTVEPTRTETENVTPRTTVTEVEREDTETVTETTTLPQRTVTVRKGTPVVKTVTEKATATATATGDAKTEVATVTAEPKYVTETQTRPATTSTKTVTAQPSTVTATTTVKNETHQTSEKTIEVERFFRSYKYAFNFSQKKDTRVIPVEKLTNWKIDFVDDSNGLVKVTKSKDGKSLDITPVKEGEGDVRIVVVDGEGNRHEYTIHVINKAEKKIETTDVVVNNHYFNVSIAGHTQTIPVPQGWEWEITEGGNYITTSEKDGKITVKPNDGVLSATAKISVHEPGEAPRNENNYIINIAADSKYDQHRVIGNSNNYVLELDNIAGEPKVVEGEDIVESLEKDKDGNWVLTPKADKTGKVVITAKDEKGDDYQFTLDVRQGTNVLVDVETANIKPNTDEAAELNTADGEYELEFKQGQDIATVNGKAVEGDTVKLTGDTNKIQASGEGVIVANLYEIVDGQRILVGVYTIIAGDRTKVETQEVEREIKDRQTVEITKGAEDHEIVVAEGADNVTTAVVEKDGKEITRVMPKPGFEGKVVVEERLGDEVVVRYTITVKPSEVKERKQDVKATSQINITRDSDLQRLVVVSGENLLNTLPNDKDGQYTTDFKPDAEGQVVIELRNSRDLPIQRWILNVSPVAPREYNYEITDRSELKLTAPEGSTYEVVEGKDLIKVTENGDQITVNPVEGAEGKAVVEFTKPNGAKERYVLDITPVSGNGAGNGSNGESSFKVSELGHFTVTIRNENTYKVIKGEEFVDITEKDGQWVLTPKEGASGNHVVVVETNKKGEIVNRHNIEITGQGSELSFREERRVLDRDIETKVNPGKGNTFTVVRGYDLIENPEPDKAGNINIKALPNKSGTVLIEERDSNGNPVRIIEAEIPETSGGSSIPAPEITWNEKTGRGSDGSITIVVEGKGDFIVEGCDKGGKCTQIDPGKIKDNGDGTHTIEQGAIPGGTTEIHVTPVGNGVVDEGGTIKINVNVDAQGNANAGNGKGDVNVGSSDPKCIASLVGLASPLLLLIPLGVLSQVNIPGLEGLRGQLNAAIQDANDRIQQGLGIYDRDRASRAAGVQGAFSVENSQMIGVAAGALGVITAGLLIGDAVLRACGQEESTSSYQLGEATDNDTLRYGSSGKPAEAAKSEESEAPKSEEAAAAEK
ncbi:hypothetical protein ACKFRZ_00145 [Corynebacterium gottingense]|uniref:hypothetical protein n=1 Tax=Corynebacterium gottingense TaxID=2041036 RepID=UPI0038CF4CB4